MQLRILLSNSTTARGIRDIRTYGIPEAAELVRRFGLAGLELSARAWLTADWIRQKVQGVPVFGIHGPWNWTWLQMRYNRKASFRDNFKGFGMMLTQPPLQWGRSVKIAQELGAEYFVLHPQTFKGIAPVPWEFLESIPGLCIENDWPEEDFLGVESALSFARSCLVGIVLDTCHIGRVPEDAANPGLAYRSVRQFLWVVHLSDYMPATKKEHLVPGHGELKWLPDFLGWLQEDKFSGPIVLEIRQPDIEPAAAIEQTLQFLARYGIEPASFLAR